MGKFHYELPKETPAGVEVSVEIDIYDDATGEKLSCLKTKVDTAHKSNGRKDSEFGFLFEHWLHEFASHNNLEWYPLDKTNLDHVDEFKYRLKVFMMNALDIVKHNFRYHHGKETYKKGMNAFGHLTNEEFAQTYMGGILSSSTATEEEEESDVLSNMLDYMMGNKVITIEAPENFFSFRGSADPVTAPDSVDWVAKGAVTEVKNQRSCGSCWAFSATGALESAYYLKYGELKEFSEQELVSCERDCYGCNGGLMSLAFEWIKEHGGLCTEEEYPYTSGTMGQSGFCKVKRLCTPDPKSTVASYTEVQPTEPALRDAVAKQPVSVAIEADQRAFQFYQEGVLEAECGDKLDHGVLVVGYGATEDGTKFWKVKNSWGATWGEAGYIRLERGKMVPNGDGECGILANAVYPTL